MKIQIYYAHTESIIKEKSLDSLLKQLPDSLHSRAYRYRSALSAYNFAVGRLLLKHGLEDLNLDINLEKVVIKENGKPHLHGVNFNISHSDFYVGCAFSLEGVIGIDIEKIKPIQFDDFKAMFTPKEWKFIKKAEYPLQTFYWLWTRKESIIKACDLNLSDMQTLALDVSSHSIVCKGKRWFLKKQNLEDNLVTTTCTEEEIKNLTIKKVDFSF